MFGMSEEVTQNFPNWRSFEERVFARFDAIDSSLRNLDSRVRDLDLRVQTLEARSLDTKPIWENALKEIADTRVEMREAIENLKSEIEKLRSETKAGTRRVEDKIDVLNHNILDVHADQRELERRVDRLESQPTR